MLALFWPDLDEASARNALNQALHELRQELGSVVVTRGRDELQIAREQLACDAGAFSAAFDEGDYALALELYGGDLLAGFHLAGAGEFEYWLDGARTRMRDLAVASARLLAERDEASGEIDSAIGWLRRLAEIDADDEVAVQHLLRLYQQKGDRPNAIRAFARFEQHLIHDLDLLPTSETIALNEEIRGAAERTDGNGERTA